MREKIKLTHWIIIIALMLWAFGLWGIRLNEPFVGRHDNNTAWISIAAENYLRYGYLELGFGQLMDVSGADVPDDNFYHTHPPLISILTSINFALFGASEASARLLAMFLTLIAGSALFSLVRKGFGVRLGLIALLLFFMVPMIAFYGQMVAHEQLILPLFLLALLVLYHHEHKPDRIKLAAISILSALLVLAGWPGVFCVAALSLYVLIWNKQRFVLIFLIGISALIGELLWILPAINSVPGFLDALYRQFFVRTSGTESQHLYDNLLDYLWQLWAYKSFRIRYTEGLFVFIAIGGIAGIMRWNHFSQQQKQVARLLMISFVPALLYMFIFQQSTFIHDYLTIYFAPGFVFLAAAGIWTLYQGTQHRIPYIRFGTAIVLIGLSLVTVASAVRWTWNLYRETDRFPYEVAEIIRENVSDDETIYSNVGWWPAIWYHSRHNIQAISEYDGSNGVVLRCQRNPQNPASDAIPVASWYCQFDE